MKPCHYLRFVFLLFFFSFSAAAMAEENEQHPIDKQIDALFANAKSRADEQGAYTKGLELWDKEMNRVYNELLKGLSKETVPLLKKSQRSWLTLRGQHVAYLDEFYKGLSGTMYLTAHAYAVMDVTRQRALALSRQLKYIDDGDYVND